MMEDAFKTCKANKEGYKTQLKKISNVDNMKKLMDTMMTNKNNIINIFKDAADGNEFLDDLKKKIGDCEIPNIIARRKSELNINHAKLARLQKDFLNMKNTGKTHKGVNIGGDLKEIEDKLKTFDKDRVVHASFLE